MLKSSRVTFYDHTSISSIKSFKIIVFLGVKCLITNSHLTIHVMIKKRFTLIIVLLTISSFSFGQGNKIGLGATIYTTGSSAPISCGTNIPFAISVYSGNIRKRCGSNTHMPPGWTESVAVDGYGCPTVYTDLRTGGYLRYQVRSASNVLEGDAGITVVRPVPTGLTITADAVCAGQTKTFTLNTSIGGVVDWTTGPGLNRTGPNGGLSTQIAYTANTYTSVTAKLTTNNNCGEYTKTNNLVVGSGLVVYPVLTLL
jgi:hypothetical protein